MIKYSMKGFVLIMLVALISIAGCSDSNKQDTYIKLDVAGTKYELSHAQFSIVDHGKNNWFYINLGQDIEEVNIITAIPSGGISLKMALNDKKELLYEEIDFDDLKDKGFEGLAEFTLTQDLSVGPGFESTP